MRFHFYYTEYPLSQELTDKSDNAAFYTRPLYGAVLGYMAKDMVSQTRNATGGGGSNTSGGEWTPPAL